MRRSVLWLITHPFRLRCLNQEFHFCNMQYSIRQYSIDPIFLTPWSTDIINRSLLYGSRSSKQWRTWENAHTCKNWLAFQVCGSLYKSAFRRYKMMRLQHILLFLAVELHVLTRAESMRDKNATRITYYSHSLLNHPFARDWLIKSCLGSSF